jgi:hypothetical protein
MGSSQFKMPMTVTFPANCVGFPDRLVTVLKYSEQYTFNSGTATPSAQVWVMNSAFDPNFSGTGHQPSYYDTFTGVYGRYFVRRFKLEIEVENTTSAVGVYAVANYADQDISGNTVEQIIEAKYSKWCNLSLPTGNAAVKRINLPWVSTLKIMGQPYTEADDNMYAVYSASPNDKAWGALKMTSVDGTTAMTAIARVVIYMEIVFKDLLPQVSS